MRTNLASRLLLPALVAGGLTSLLFLPAKATRAQELNPAVLAAEKRRVEAVEKVKPAVVAVFAAGGQGGGSGVLIDEDGYALTNFHVVEGSGPVMKCGLPDGVLYDGVLVGLDKVGDVALIKLLPKKDGQKFPFAKLGDSDKVKAGDWSLAMGNPFLLATDYTPTVTFGLISGTNRYQYPAGTLLEYTDCLQIDTSINPGNSGGPLFNLDGELVGINGRGSFEKRGRVNSGVGYAISINQIKNFMGQLRAGLDTDHATLGAVIVSDDEDGALEKFSVANLLEESDAFRRGLQIGDELLKFNGRHITSVNQYKNILGLYPKGWRLPLAYRHAEERLNKEKVVEEREVLVRLMGVQRQELKQPGEPQPKPQPGPKPVPQPKGDSPAAKLYEARPGFANWYFNRQARDNLLKGFARHSDFTKLRGAWTLEGEAKIGARTQSVKITLDDAKEDNKAASFTLGGDITFDLLPLKNDAVSKLQVPPGSGGLLMALYQWRQLLTLPVGDKTFEADFSHGGTEPFYMPAPDGAKPDFAKQRQDCEVLRTRTLATPAKWYFAPKDHTLLGFECSVLEREDDPCEVYLSDYKDVDGRKLPHKIEVIYGKDRYATLTVKKYELK